MHWTYKGVDVFRVDRLNTSGIRWYARCGLGFCLRASTKADMRQLITEYRGKHP